MSTRELVVYRRIGPFDEHSLPEGLRAEHRLKPGVWAELSVLAGGVGFIWDDTGERTELWAGDTQSITPERPHHLTVGGSFELAIAFLRES